MGQKKGKKKPRYGLRATLVSETLFVSGGFDDSYFTSILSWDPVAESWQQVDHLSEARQYHAAVAVPASLVEC